MRGRLRSPGWSFCLQRRLHPVAALRLFTQAQPPQHRQTRLLHSPAVLLGLLLLTRRRTTAWALLGMDCHVALDAYDTTRRAPARVAAPALAQRPAQAVGLDRVAGP